MLKAVLICAFSAWAERKSIKCNKDGTGLHKTEQAGDMMIESVGIFFMDLPNLLGFVSEHAIVVVAECHSCRG
jgi:hypothetical protein